MGDSAEVLVLGGGAGGLLTAIILANGGHAVTVLERDSEPPPATDDDAWAVWQRRGVNQFRQPHNLLGRARQILAAEVPDTWAEIDRIGVRADFRFTAPDPDARTDEQYAHLALTGVRRATLERRLALCADAAPGIDVRRGVTVTGLTTGSTVRDGSPHVTGVTTLEHGEFAADLVVDACGRRTPVGDWVEALGSPVERSSESDGFTYHCRWYRHSTGLPPLIGGPFGGLLPGAVCLRFPGDANTVGIAMAGLGSDRLLRRLNDPDRFDAVCAALPGVAPWSDPAVATPITDIMPMGAIASRHLRLRTDDSSGVTGLINTGDSVASTNPSLGRGIAVAADLAVELRRLLADTPSPGELVDRWDVIQRERHLPWLTDSIQDDDLKRDAFAAMTAGRPPGPPAHPDLATMQRAARVDMTCWSRWMSVGMVFETPNSCLDDPELMEQARSVADDAPPPPPPAMTRAELEALLA